MKIPNELIEKWKPLRSRGDNKRISEEYPWASAMAVGRAIEGRECSDDTFMAIRDFYAAKEAKLFPPAKTQSHE
jgi:hypothetical protein